MQEKPKLHEQIIETLTSDEKARRTIDQVEHGEVVFVVQDGKPIRWRIGTGDHVKRTKEDPAMGGFR